jgi:hypothetical protein
MKYLRLMSLLCLLGRHRPMLTSIIQRGRGFSALCDHCGAPIERDPSRRWVNATPLISSDRAPA